MSTKKYRKSIKLNIVIILGILGFFLIFAGAIAVPTGPNTVNITNNSTKGSLGPQMVNISGGYFAYINITTTTQDLRWKAFVGYVIGKYALEDGAGSKIYDWTTSTNTGRVFATRNSTTVSWSNINCSNATGLLVENLNMNLTSPNDNLTATFNITAGALHNGFFVGSVPIAANHCPTLETYVTNSTHADHYFEEEALFDGYNTVYATTIETTRPAGYNGVGYDFQMIVPEIGLSGYTGTTAYYIYIELA